MIYSFGEHELDTAVVELRRRGQRLALRHLPFRLLVHLIRRRPAAVSKAELVREVWQGVHVDDGAVRTAAYELRRALGQSGADGPWLRTVPGFGYRFAGVVDEAPTSAAPMAAVPSLPRSAETDPDHLAMLQWLEFCREVLEQGHRDTFGLLVQMVRVWTELKGSSAVQASLVAR